MGQIAGVPIHALLGGKLRDEVALTFALSIDEPDRMAAAAAECPYCDCFKIKVVRGGGLLKLKKSLAIAEAANMAVVSGSGAVASIVVCVAAPSGLTPAPRAPCWESPRPSSARRP